MKRSRWLKATILPGAPLKKRHVCGAFSMPDHVSPLTSKPAQAQNTRNAMKLGIIERAQRLALDAPDSLIAVYGMDNRCIWASPSHFTILGYPEDETVGARWNKFVAPEDHPHAQLAGDDAFFHGRSIRFHLNAATKTGVRIPLQCEAWIKLDRPHRRMVLLFQGTPVDR
jgi:PAS domain-containing protein